MALIAMAVYSTEENKKDQCLARTLSSLSATVDFTKHRLFLSVNAMTKDTELTLKHFSPIITEVIYNDTNLGTAEAINLCWKKRNAGENCIKMDDDIVIHQSKWVDLMEEAISRDNNIGIIGLKRKDCWEHPKHENPEFRSNLINVPQKAGEKWIVVEQAKHIIGTCQMYNSDFLDVIGYLYQPSLYGYDDVLASWRAHVAKFKTVFLPQIEIDHIDEGNTPYQDWKHKHSGTVTQTVIKLVDEYLAGTKSIYYNPYES